MYEIIITITLLMPVFFFKDYRYSQGMGRTKNDRGIPRSIKVLSNPRWLQLQLGLGLGLNGYLNGGLD